MFRGKSREEKIEEILEKDSLSETGWSWGINHKYIDFQYQGNRKAESSDTEEIKSKVEGFKDLGIDFRGLSEDNYSVGESDHQVGRGNYASALRDAMDFVEGRTAEDVIDAAGRLFNSSEDGSYQREMARWALDKACERGYKEEIFEGMG